MMFESAGAGLDVVFGEQPRIHRTLVHRRHQLVNIMLIADIGPAIIEPPAEQTVRHVTPPGPHVDGFGHDEVTAAPDAWVVEAGDHLWAIAEHLLEAAGRPTDDGTVAGYWTRLIAANTAALDGDPDLLHVGQVISLPPLDQG